MNPYEVLGLPNHASESEIKAAYRKLVKAYHPDKNPSPDAEQLIKSINEAYDILSDPTKKAAYDNYGSVEPQPYAYEEDPREVYRREYIRKKNAEAKLKREKEEAFKKLIHKIFRFANYIIFPFVLMLVADYCLPTTSYTEPAIRGWQQRSGGGRHSRGVLFSYMKTEHFEFAVPDEVHLNYDYYENPQPLTIEATPILKIPKTVSFREGEYILSFEAGETIYSFFFPLHVLLLLSSTFTFFKKEYSLATYIVCFIPAICFLLLAVKYFTS